MHGAILAHAGSFGGQGWLPGPWDSVVAAVLALVIYLWGIRVGTTYLEARDDIVEEIEHSHDEWEDQPSPAERDTSLT